VRIARRGNLKTLKVWLPIRLKAIASTFALG
jgi:hypothetical protein